MKRYLFALCVMAIAFTSCRKEALQISEDKAILSFSFKAEKNPELILVDVDAEISDMEIIAIQGNTNDRSSLIAEFTFEGAAVAVNGVQQISGETVNDFSKPVTYTVYAEDGSARNYVVKLKTFTGIPIVYLTAEAPIVNTEDYVNGTMKIDGNMEFTDGLYNGKMSIRGRGNSTWMQEKKPYKIKLPSKAKILGMPADKEWALLANYLDKSLMRNKVGLEISSMFNMKWTPKTRYVEVFLNGEYLGNYLLAETVKTSVDRLNIGSMDVNNPLDSLGDFLVEVDQRLDGTTYFRTQNQVPFVFKTPEVIPEANLEYLKRFIQNIETKIYSYDFNPTTGYAATLDIDKFVDWYLISELMINHDAAFFSSIYMYRENGGKLSMGPMWDMDLSSGNVSYGHVSPEGWGLINSSWIFMLVRDGHFQQKMKERWNANKQKIATIPNYIDKQEKYLKFSNKENFSRWDILNSLVYPNAIVTGSYAGEVAYFKNWMERRIAWMDAELNK